MSNKAFVSLLLVLTASSCATRRQELSVGSKNFTEQVILGEIVAQHLENRLKLKVDRKLNLGGTNVVHQALVTDQLDVYPEYTGTALAAILKIDMTENPEAIHARLRDVYATQFNAEWMKPLGFDNSFAMVVRKEDAAKLKVQTLSDAERSPAWRLGVGYEFETRPDGLAALNTVYDIPWQGAPVTMDLGLLYRALEQKQVGMVAGNETDGILSHGQFVVLKDDKNAFPGYQAALVARLDAYERFPGCKQALEELAGKFSNEVMRRLNYEADVKKAAIPDVAAAFLRDARLR